VLGAGRVSETSPSGQTPTIGNAARPFARVLSQSQLGFPPLFYLLLQTARLNFHNSPISTTLLLQTGIFLNLLNF
jgi:hypothetical protein